MVATALLLLLHAPPPELVSVILPPAHTIEEPAIAVGKGSTVRVVVITQPAAGMYVIVVVPAVMPVTMPEVIPIVAMPVELLVHVPPIAASLSVVVLPMQTLVMPVMGGGGGVTVAIVAIAQPVVDMV
jgi:hypothetical protein